MKLRTSQLKMLIFELVNLIKYVYVIEIGVSNLCKNEI